MNVPNVSSALLSLLQPLYVVPGHVPGLLKPGNLDLRARPRVKNPDGSISTVRSITVTGPNGVAYLIPTVIGNRVVSNQEAVRHFQRTGENLGVFKNEDAANAYSQLLHEEQAKMINPRLLP